MLLNMKIFNVTRINSQLDLHNYLCEKISSLARLCTITKLNRAPHKMALQVVDPWCNVFIPQCVNVLMGYTIFSNCSLYSIGCNKYFVFFLKLLDTFLLHV